MIGFFVIARTVIGCKIKLLNLIIIIIVIIIQTFIRHALSTAAESEALAVGRWVKVVSGCYYTSSECFKAESEGIGSRERSHISMSKLYHALCER